MNLLKKSTDKKMCKSNFFSIGTIQHVLSVTAGTMEIKKEANIYDDQNRLLDVHSNYTR